MQHIPQVYEPWGVKRRRNFLSEDASRVFTE